jgi:hypothetical protein
MANLPIQRMVLYKHGVGFFERYGAVGNQPIVTLSFKKGDMNDILKSLAAFPQGEGRVVNISYETPEDKRSALAKAPLVLGESSALLDLLRSLRGRRVSLQVSATESAAESSINGCLLGVDLGVAPAQQPLISILVEGHSQDSTPNLRSYSLDQIRGLDLLEPQSGKDLRYVLELSQANEDQRQVSILLDRPDETLLVTYVAPTPTWRVSYRLVYEADREAAGSDSSADSANGQLLIQGWGIVDNQLDEDLDNVELTLIAGQPISFVYDLYTPRWVDRPRVEDEARTVPGPVMFDAAMSSSPAPDMTRARMPHNLSAVGVEQERAAPRRDFAGATQVQAAGVARGEFFQYDVTVPISIKRGQSAMVPILEARLAGRKCHLFNQAKLPNHPVVTIIATNATSLTLERGPATVQEGQDYVGEAVLPFTPSQGDLFVPYSVDLGTTVTTQVEDQWTTASIAFGTLNEALVDQFLIHDQYQIRKTTYQIDNRNIYPIQLVIEQNSLLGYELFDMAEPTEVTAESRRWPLPIAAKTSRTFVVQERQLVSRRESLKNLDYVGIRRYFDARFIDKQTFDALSEVLRYEQEIRRIQQVLDSNAQQDQHLSQQQSEATTNLQRLDREGEEGRTRQAFVAKVQRWDLQREALSQESNRLKPQIEALKQAYTESLRRLATE